VSELIKVQVNEKKIDLPAGSTIANALEAAGYKHAEGAVIGIVAGREEARSEVATEFRVFTSKGEIRIELTGDALKHAWLESYGRFTASKAKWATGNAIAFGPAASGVQAASSESEYKRWDVSFGTGGYDAKNTYMIISKARHSSDYGVKGGGVFARVISGSGILSSLGNDDFIKGIEPVVMLEKFANKILTTDPSTLLEDGMEVYTEVTVELSPKAKEGAEHFYAAVKSGTFRVDFGASSFISTDMMLGDLTPYENLAARSEGTVSVRTDGKGRGRVYISRADMTSNIYHSIVGRVTKGLELVKMASPGQRIAIKTVPMRLSTLGISLAQSCAMLDQANVKYEKTGYTGDDAVVVQQEPATTMEIASSGKVRLVCLPKSKLIEIELYEDTAPSTAEYFRRATGLKQHAVGGLPLFFKYEETMLFKGKPVSVGELIPENKPEEGSIVKAGEIGLTNMASKHAGMIGVRFADNNKFGPTGEKYDATNIVGRIKDINRMKDMKEKDMIYFIEV
jgi:putative methanogenesis marker protein 3